MKLKKHLSKLYLVLQTLGLLITLMYAMPTAYATYKCNFEGLKCQYSLYGPSEKAFQKNVEYLTETTMSSDAKFLFQETEITKKDTRLDLAIFDQQQNRTIFSDKSSNIITSVLADDRGSAIVITGPDHAETAHIYLITKDKKLKYRQYDIWCYSEDKKQKLEIRNLSLNLETKVAAFDWVSNCISRTIKPSHRFGFGRSSQTSGRVFFQFDTDYFLEAVYPNGEWEKPPSKADLTKQEEELALIDYQRKATAEYLKNCEKQKRQEIQEQNLRNFLFVCSAPNEIDGQSIYWKLANYKTIISGKSASKFNVRNTGCDAEDYTVEGNLTNEFVQVCSFPSRGETTLQIKHITFVDSDFNIHSVKLECACWKMEISNIEYGSKSLSFDVGASSPKFEFDDQKVTLGGAPDEGAFALASYRGKVTLNFYEAGYLRNVEFVEPH